MMKVGDLVRPVRHNIISGPVVEEGWTGLVVGHVDEDPIIYWNEEFNSEREFKEQIQVVGGD